MRLLSTWVNFSQYLFLFNNNMHIHHKQKLSIFHLICQFLEYVRVSCLNWLMIRILIIHIQLIEIYMDQLAREWQMRYYQTTEEVYSQFLTIYPRFDNYNRFEKFIMLNLAVIALYLVVSCFRSISPKRIYNRVAKFVLGIGPVRRELEKNLEKARVEILSEYPSELRPKLDKIPYKPPEIQFGDASEKESLKGKLSGSRYALQAHSKFVASLSKHFSYSNPLHYELCPYVKQMENEIIDMTAEAIGLKDEKGLPCGTCQSGGTESIIMAILAYRQYKMKNHGVVKPNLVICQTGHVAALKACDYLNIEPRIVSFNKNFQMNISEMKRNIDSNTICVYASYPNYPYGTCDPISIIGPYCHARKVPVHVDMCLGGFISPFIEQNWTVPKGITSISADPHKYGLSAKGISVLLYSSDQYRKNQFFVTSYWPGGLYGTPGVAGSRTGVYISSAWISMMKLGVKGYRDNARQLRDTTIFMAKELRKLDFEVFGEPKVCIISMVHKKHSVNKIFKFMKKRGWGLSLMQKPLSLHFSFTPLNCLKKDQMLKDFKECCEFLEKDTTIEKDSSEVQLYGACASLPQSGSNEIMATVLDIFIDLN